MKLVRVALALLLPQGVLAEEEPIQPAADAPLLHYSVGIGAGHAYGLLGAHGEIRISHWAAFLAAGVEAAAGFKWYSGEGSGFVLSLHASYYPMLLGIEDELTRVTVVAFTAGWRIRNSDRTYIEIAIGPAYAFQRYKALPDDPRNEPTYIYSSGWGSVFLDVGTKPVLPDAAIGFGYEF